MTEPGARILADSVSEAGHRVTTLEVTIHRFVLAELNTHRVFSRNSASSRAIPLSVQLERVRTDPAIPVVFPAEQRGMQGGDAVEDQALAQWRWLQARDRAAESAEQLAGQGVHKSICNRLLEPFLWHVVIVTSTDWKNFFAQRCSPLAQPELRVAAEAMEAAIASSEPALLGTWRWHQPLILPDDDPIESDLRHVSAARCARVSYLTHDGRRDVSEDLKLYQRLVTAFPPHASPLEHVCTPLLPGQPQVGNLTGFRQLRHEVLDI